MAPDRDRPGRRGGARGRAPPGRRHARRSSRAGARRSPCRTSRRPRRCSRGSPRCPTPRRAARVYLWEFARDNAPVVDSLSRARLAARRHRGRLARRREARLRPARLRARGLALLARARRDVPRRRRCPGARRARSAAHVGRALVMQRRRKWDASLDELNIALAAHATPEALEALVEDADPARPHRRGDLGRASGACGSTRTTTRSHYLLGNGYARKQLHAARSPPTPRAFADAAGARALARADAALAAGRRDAARARLRAARRRRTRAGSTRACGSPRSTSRTGASPRRATAASPRSRSAPSTAARTRCWPRRSSRSASRSTCTAPDYERRFAATRDARRARHRALRRQLEVALAAPPEARRAVGRAVEGVRARCWSRAARPSTSSRSTCCSRECPDQETLRDQRINYDSRLWDDVRGCGGYHTVTGIEDVERTIFDRYNTVLHELTHQVHGVLTADDVARDPGALPPGQGARRRDARRLPVALRRRQRVRVLRRGRERARLAEARRLRPARGRARAARRDGSRAARRW